ncbi:MAG: hypothetical protein AB2669_00525 [Candidatus Thiodiazotropha endolucinida]
MKHFLLMFIMISSPAFAAEPETIDMAWVHDEKLDAQSKTFYDGSITHHPYHDIKAVAAAIMIENANTDTVHLTNIWNEIVAIRIRWFLSKPWKVTFIENDYRAPGEHFAIAQRSLVEK